MQKIKHKKWLYFLALVILASCKNEVDTGFSVSGTLENQAAAKLVLNRMTSEGFRAVDSVITSTEGQFTLEGNAPGKNLYALTSNLSGEYITLVIGPGDEINLEISSYKMPVTYSVEGSEDSKLVKKIQDELFENLHEKMDLSKNFQDWLNNFEEENAEVRKDSVEKKRMMLRNKIQQLDEEHKTRTTRLIKQNPGSLAVLMALYEQTGYNEYLYSPELDFEIFALVDSVLHDKYPGADAVKELRKTVQNVKEQPVRIGKKAPNITLPSPGGEDVSLYDIKGQYILLDFWASWCGPCRTENPTLVKAYQEYKDDGFQIFQVSLDKSRAAWLDAIEKDRLNWIHASDLQYWNSTVVGQYKIQGIPTNYLLDENMVIIDKNLRGRMLEQRLAELFNE